VLRLSSSAVIALPVLQIWFAPTGREVFLCLSLSKPFVQPLVITILKSPWGICHRPAKKEKSEKPFFPVFF
jgi:hypothetical protein